MILGMLDLKFERGDKQGSWGIWDLQNIDIETSLIGISSLPKIKPQWWREATRENDTKQLNHGQKSTCKNIWWGEIAKKNWKKIFSSFFIEKSHLWQKRQQVSQSHEFPVVSDEQNRNYIVFGEMFQKRHQLALIDASPASLSNSRAH